MTEQDEKVDDFQIVDLEKTNLIDQVKEGGVNSTRQFTKMVVGAFHRPTLSANYTDDGVTLSYGDKTTELFPSLDMVDNEKAGQSLGVEPNKVWMFKTKTMGRELKPKGLPQGPGKYFDPKNNFIAKRLGDELLEKYHFATMRDSREIFVYENGIYTPNGEIIIKEQSQVRLGDKSGTHYKNEVVDYVASATFTDRREFDQDLTLVNLQNGVYHLDNMELDSHNPNLKLIQQIPVNYDKEKDCPEIKEFLKQILPNEADRQAIIELFGYAIYRSYPIQKAFMFVGDGANGKSTIINVLKIFLGKENVTSRSLQELEENRFSTAELYGKLANLYPDLSDRALQGTGKFKALTGSDPITGEHKFQGGFVFVNYSKQVYSCNKVPMVYDDSDAFYRRWLIINFPNKFEGDNCDKHILEKLTTPAELSGLFNFAVEALRELLKRETFANDKETNEIRDEYIRKSDSVQAFIMDMVETSPENDIEKKDVYLAYLEYCRQKNYPSVNDRLFFKRFVKHVRVEEYRSDREGRPRVWRGIRLSTEIPENSTSTTSNHFPTLSSCNILEGNKVENRLDIPDVPDKTKQNFHRF